MQVVQTNTPYYLWRLLVYLFLKERDSTHKHSTIGYLSHTAHRNLSYAGRILAPRLHIYSWEESMLLSLVLHYCAQTE